MKKLLLLTFVFCMSLTLFGCGGMFLATAEAMFEETVKGKLVAGGTENLSSSEYSHSNGEIITTDIFESLEFVISNNNWKDKEVSLFTFILKVSSLYEGDYRISIDLIDKPLFGSEVKTILYDEQVKLNIDDYDGETGDYFKQFEAYLIEPIIDFTSTGSIRVNMYQMIWDDLNQEYNEEDCSFYWNIYEFVAAGNVIER